MFKKIKDHLDGVEEGYFEHLYHASIYGSKMILGGLGAIAHAICPAICQYTASKTVSALHEQLQERLARARAKENAKNAADQQN
jgi:hypothetical protein